MIQVPKNTASSTQSRQIMSGYERFDRWIQLRKTRVCMRGEGWHGFESTGKRQYKDLHRTDGTQRIRKYPLVHVK